MRLFDVLSQETMGFLTCDDRVQRLPSFRTGSDLLEDVKLNYSILKFNDLSAAHEWRKSYRSCKDARGFIRRSLDLQFHRKKKLQVRMAKFTTREYLYTLAL